MKLYIKDDIIKARSKIVIVRDGMQTLNPSEEMILADGWVEYVTPEPTPEELLAEAKKNLRSSISFYDSSEDVNGFYMQGKEMWLDKATRAGLMLRFQAEQAMGKEITTLWYDNSQYELPLASAFQMLYALEVYASQCYDNTQRHLAHVDALLSIEDVENYNYQDGYPDKLKF